MKRTTRDLFALPALLLALLLMFSACDKTPAASADPSGSISGSEAVSAASADDSADVPDSADPDIPDPSGSSGGTSVTGAKSSAATVQTTKRSGSNTQNRPTASFSGSSIDGRVANLKGRVVRLQVSPGEDKTTKSYKVFQENIKAVEKKLNCTVKQVPLYGTAGDDNSIMMSVLSGKPIVDIWVQNGSGEFLPNYKSGLLQNLSGMNVFAFDKVDWNPCMQLMTYSNKAYAIRPAANGSTMWNTVVLLYNHRLLTEYIPQYAGKLAAWQKSGEWTWDKLEEVCKAFNKAAGANKSLTAFFDRSGVAYTAMLATRGTDWVVADKKGKLSFNGTDSKAQEAMNQHKKYVTEGTLIFDNAANVNEGYVANMVGGDGQEKYSFLNGQCLFAFNTVGGYYWNVFQYAGTAQTVRDNVGAMQIPKMKTSDAYTGLTPMYMEGHAIPFGVQKPAEVATVMNYLYAEPLVKLSDAEERTAWFTNQLEPTLNSKTGDLTMSTFTYAYDHAGSTMLALSFYGIYGSANIYGDANSGWIGKYLYDISSGNIAQSAAIAAVKSKYNKILADLT